MPAGPVRDYILSEHAEMEMARRGLARELVERVLAQLEQRLSVRRGRVVLQARLATEGSVYLWRVFVDVDRDPPEVVTAYRTSKIEKYWSQQP